MRASPALAMIDEGLLKQVPQSDAQCGAGHEVGRRFRGSAELILRVQHEDARVSIQVVDTGPGIPREMLDEIFHPYVSGRRGGTGLGLPTSRRIVEEHGGRLLVESEMGRGTAFTIQLPESSA